MKLAYSVGTPEAPGPLMAFYGDFERNVAEIKALGYDALELFVRSPREMDVAAVKSVIAKSGLDVAAVGTNPAMLRDGLTLLDPDENVRRKAIDRVKDLVDFSEEYHAPVCIGKYRGQLWKGREEQAWEELKNALTEICSYAAGKGVPVMLEPQTRQNINNLNTTAEAVRFIEALGFDNLGILYDTFHADLDETSLAASILDVKGRIGFVHLADSNRLPPGIGGINFTDVLAVLRMTGYQGYLSMEIAQHPSSSVVADISLKNIKFVLDNCLK